jgi:hypothetical protein
MFDARFLGRAAVLALSVFFCSCSKSAEEKLAGKWVGERIDNVSADRVAEATGFIKGTTFEFAGDKLTVSVPAEAPRTGVFQVTRADGDQVVVSVARSDGATHDEAMLTMLSDKTMRWDIGQGRDVLMVRRQ